MCLSSSTTTQPAGCASSSSSSLKPCPYPGFMVGQQLVLARTVNTENKELGIFWSYIRDVSNQ